MALAIVLGLVEELRLTELTRKRRQKLRTESLPLQLPTTEFMDNFRLKKSMFEELCQIIIPLLPATQRASAVKPEIKILTALSFYAHGSYQKPLGTNYNLGLSQSCVSLAIKEVTEALNSPAVLEKFIQFPKTQAEREAIAARFMSLYGIPGVVGCIDGTHVALICPVEDEEAYYNRKQYHSLNVLVICDADLKILHVDASFGGQSHDSHVFNNCPVKAYLQQLHEIGELCWLLGDSGYAQRPYMMTPILNAAPNSPDDHYTKTHIRTRNVVERCFGVLKTRWRCLLAHRTLYYAPVKAGKIVNACVVLHNFVNDARIAIDKDEIRQDRRRQPTTVRPPGELRNGGGGREELVARLWQSRQQ